MKRWRLIETGIAEGGWNMAVDEALLYSFKQNDMPILRLYRWHKALSLGRFSKPHKSLDMEMLQKQKIPFVRRMTGGGVFVHGNELSYSLIMPPAFLKGRGPKESYRYLCRFLIRFYQKLGCKARFAVDMKLNSARSNICLASNEAYDLLIAGRKIGGNAQRYIKQACFQHGSIPLSFDEGCFEPLFLENSGLKKAAALMKLGVTKDHKALVKLLIESFCETFNVDVIESTLSTEEAHRAKKLMMNKYAKREWNIDAAQKVNKSQLSLSNTPLKLIFPTRPGMD